jgi:hypothetical protein
MRHLIFILFPISVFSQTIAERHVDEFTGHRILSTSWEWLSYGGSSATIYFRIKGVNNEAYLDVKYGITSGMYGKIFSISKGDPFMLKLDNDTVITLEAIEGQVACKGCGVPGYIGSAGYGTWTKYRLDFKDIHFLMKHDVLKTRMYTNSGYVNQAVNRKRTSYIKNALKLCFP